MTIENSLGVAGDFIVVPPKKKGMPLTFTVITSPSKTVTLSSFETEKVYEPRL